MSQRVAFFRDDAAFFPAAVFPAAVFPDTSSLPGRVQAPMPWDRHPFDADVDWILDHLSGVDNPENIQFQVAGRSCRWSFPRHTSVSAGPVAAELEARRMSPSTAASGSVPPLS